MKYIKKILVLHLAHYILMFIISNIIFLFYAKRIELILLVGSFWGALFMTLLSLPMMLLTVIKGFRNSNFSIILWMIVPVISILNIFPNYYKNDQGDYIAYLIVLITFIVVDIFIFYMYRKFVNKNNII